MPDPVDLSVQLYTVRAALDADVDGTLAALAGIGFRLVEPFGLVEHAEGLAGRLAAHGLSAPTAHADLLTADPGAVFEAATALGIGTMIQPWVDPARWQTADEIERIADELNTAADWASTEGLRVGYHNHHFELETRIDGRHALEVFADHLEPDVVLEVDTYWAFAVGADVPALLERLGDRVAAIHVKDGDGTLDPKRQVAAGAGVLPIPEILGAAPAALRVLELDDTDGDLLEALRDSRRYVLGLAGA
jgi:sugar phosphate isomerase/epimerase